jgi:hypothetical protein
MVIVILMRINAVVLKTVAHHLQLKQAAAMVLIMIATILLIATTVTVLQIPLVATAEEKNRHVPKIATVVLIDAAKKEYAFNHLNSHFRKI